MTQQEVLASIKSRIKRLDKANKELNRKVNRGLISGKQANIQLDQNLAVIGELERFKIEINYLWVD